MQLRKVVNHPYLLPGADPDPEQTTEDLVQASAKLRLLDRLLPRLKAGGHRVVIFSGFKGVLDLLEDYCGLRRHKYLRLDGSTNRVQRAINMAQFQREGSKYFVFMMTTRAGGLGITLNRADTVVLYDSDWNPQADLQAMDRVHRIGQRRPVHVYRLVTRGTVEDRLVQRAQKKLYLDRMVNRGSTAMADELESVSKDELLKTLKFGCHAVFDPEAEEQELTDAQLAGLMDRSGMTGPDGRPAPPQQQQGEEGGGGGGTMASAADFDAEDTPFAMTTLEGKDFAEERKITSVSQIAEAYHKQRNQKRERKSRFMKVDGHTVLKANNYSLESGELSVYESEATKKVIPKISSSGRQVAGRDYHNEDHCLLCWDGGELALCDRCPASLHPRCLDPGYKSIQDVPPRFSCPHHACFGCGRGAAEAGGLLFRCLACPYAACEHDLPNDAEIMGRCRRMERLGYRHPSQACYVLCSPACRELVREAWPHIIEYEASDDEEDSDEERNDGLEKTTVTVKRTKRGLGIKVEQAMEGDNHCIGVRITGFAAHSSGQQAGLVIGDVINRMDGLKLLTVYDYDSLFKAGPPKKHIILSVIKKKKTKKQMAKQQICRKRARQTGDCGGSKPVGKAASNNQKKKKKKKVVTNSCY